MGFAAVIVINTVLYLNAPLLGDARERAREKNGLMNFYCSCLWSNPSHSYIIALFSKVLLPLFPRIWDMYVNQMKTQNEFLPPLRSTEEIGRKVVLTG